MSALPVSLPAYSPQPPASEWRRKALMADDLRGCRSCGVPVVFYRGRVAEPMDAINLYRRHICDGERARMGVGPSLAAIRECICGFHVAVWVDGTKEDWPSMEPHDHAAVMAGQARERKAQRQVERAELAAGSAAKSPRRVRGIEA